MKLLGLSFVLIITGFASAVFAADGLNLNNTNAVNLNISKSSIDVLVSYPGEDSSGVCGLEIRADSLFRNQPISAFIAKLVITGVHNRETDVVKVMGPTLAVVPLRANSYIDGINITTIDGSSLAETIRRTMGKNGEKRRVIVVARSCK